MYSIIKEAIKTVAGTRYLSEQELYYAYKWIEDGSLEVLVNTFHYIYNEMCLRGL